MIAYALRQLRPHEKNYPMHDLKLVAMIFCSRAVEALSFGAASGDFH